jgi:mRNA interferase MazF
MAFDAGDVVLVPFPYRDRQAERTRPAVIVSAQAYKQHGDLIVAAITSHPSHTPYDYALTDWAAAGLRLPSTVRMLLATMAQSRVVLQVGRLTALDWSQVQAHVLSLFAWP